MMVLWTWELERRAVVEIGDGDSAVELALYFDHDGCTCAAWVLSQPCCLLVWTTVGMA
jgi:hypothetical protein